MYVLKSNSSIDLMTIQPQKKFKVLLIGDICTDIYQYGTVDRISPEAPVPVFKPQHEEERSGMAGNVRENLAKLGCDVVMFSGNISTKTRLIDIRSKQQIVRIDNDVLTPTVPLHPVMLQQLPSIDAIVISDYNKGLVSYEMIEDLRKSYTGPIFVDTKKTDLQRFEGCYVKINSLERSLAKSLPSNLIVTLGEQGVLYNSTQYPAALIGVTDVTGAGDTFLAALTWQYLTQNNIEDAIKYAIRASSVTVQHIGVYAPTHEEIECV